MKIFPFSKFYPRSHLPVARFVARLFDTIARLRINMAIVHLVFYYVRSSVCVCYSALFHLAQVFQIVFEIIFTVIVLLSAQFVCARFHSFSCRFLFANYRRIIKRYATHKVRARTDGTITFFPSLPVSHHSASLAKRSDWLRTTIRSTNRVTTMRQRRVS